MLGILVSSFASRSSTSIFVLLLIWVILVVLLPSALGTVSKKLRPLPSFDVIRQNKQAQIQSIRERHRVSEYSKEGAWPPEGSNAWLRRWASYITQQSEQETKFSSEHVNKQLAQAQLAMNISRISPVAVYQYALESVAGVGIPRYKDFIQQVQIHAQQFVDFIKSTDRHDKDSPHVYFVEAGMSQKPVNFDDVPKFEDKPELDIAFKSAMFDITLLILQVIFLFMCAHVAFLKMDVK
jgi:ABC-type transport system involved in multi-copper enzyme maturation permease subunit